MGVVINLIGNKYGRLDVIERDFSRNDDNKAFWICKCSCGNTKSITGRSLRNGKTVSCGCYRKEITSKNSIINNTKHGLSQTLECEVWYWMINRCYNKNNTSYSNYGERNIYVCEEWRANPIEFIKWLKNTNWEKGMEIDRIDNNLGYSPENCRIVTHQQNSQNKRNLKNTSSQYKGVSFNKNVNKWQVSTKKDKKTYYLGLFTSEIEGAKAYDLKAKELFGEYACLNFPE